MNLSIVHTRMWSIWLDQLANWRVKRKRLRTSLKLSRTTLLSMLTLAAVVVEDIKAVKRAGCGRRKAYDENNVLTILSSTTFKNLVVVDNWTTRKNSWASSQSLPLVAAKNYSLEVVDIFLLNNLWFNRPINLRQNVSAIHYMLHHIISRTEYTLSVLVCEWVTSSLNQDNMMCSQLIEEFGRQIFNNDSPSTSHLSAH